jgi:Mn2+/Fe2+ NRAMP family transporter
MNRIFLGPPLHWLLIATIIGLGWYSGLGRTHVSQFNVFLILLLAIVMAIIVVVLKTSPADQQVTREPLEDTPLEGRDETSSSKE